MHGRSAAATPTPRRQLGLRERAVDREPHERHPHERPQDVRRLVGEQRRRRDEPEPADHRRAHRQPARAQEQMHARRGGDVMREHLHLDEPPRRAEQRAPRRERPVERVVAIEHRVAEHRVAALVVRVPQREPALARARARRSRDPDRACRSCPSRARSRRRAGATGRGRSRSPRACRAAAPTTTRRGARSAAHAATSVSGESSAECRSE